MIKCRCNTFKNLDKKHKGWYQFNPDGNDTHCPYCGKELFAQYRYYGVNGTYKDDEGNIATCCRCGIKVDNKDIEKDNNGYSIIYWIIFLNDPSEYMRFFCNKCFQEFLNEA